MTINQYQILAKAIADKIIALSGDPNHVRHLNRTKAITCYARNPKDKGQTSIKSGDSNVMFTFDVLSNPNNPNYKFRTLKPGSISAFDSIYQVNVDPTAYHFDSAQFKKFIDAINDGEWTLD